MLSNERLVVDELMDSPDVDPSAHSDALAGLGRINSISHAARRMAAPIIAFARHAKLDHLTMLDAACGGGDVAIEIATLAGLQGIKIELTLLDRSHHALQLATAAAQRAGISAKGVQADLMDHWNDASFDVVTCSLFLHHVRRGDQVIELLRRMRSIAGRQVVISDLRRCRTGVAAAWIGSRILSRSPIVHFDAPASVRAAWTISELAEFTVAAGMTNGTVERCWPWRMLLVWERAGEVA